MAHTIQETIELAVKTAIFRAHPIGSYYLTEGTENPQDFIGGGWQKLTGRYVLQCSDDSHEAGTTVEAGLPNIAGSATYVNSDDMDQTNYPDTGCFYWGIYNYNKTTNIINKGPAKRNLKFSASRSNSIYGRSDTVQPPARIVNVWKRVS